MGQTGFLSALHLPELDGSGMGLRIYDCVKNMSTNAQSSNKNFIDYHKFVKACAILAKG